MIDSASRDVNYALRTMRKRPGFAVTTMFTLALVIGANTAMFTVVRAVLLRPLRYSDPERLVQITGGATPIRYDAIRTGARSYSGVGAYFSQIEEVSITGTAAPEPLKQARVSANFLNIIGVESLLGRRRRDFAGHPRQRTVQRNKTDLGPILPATYGCEPLVCRSSDPAGHRSPRANRSWSLPGHVPAIAPFRESC